MLDVTRLRVLVAVARYGSVTAAARALNYAQPSVSHHLARLEAETGTKLIQRAGRGIRLTDAGRLLAERAAEVIGWRRFPPRWAPSSRPPRPCCASTSPASTCG
jgi:DNA-binding transcriptional LysR family regulator